MSSCFLIVSTIFQHLAFPVEKSASIFSLQIHYTNWCRHPSVCSKIIYKNRRKKSAVIQYSGLSLHWLRALSISTLPPTAWCSVPHHRWCTPLLWPAFVPPQCTPSQTAVVPRYGVRSANRSLRWVETPASSLLVLASDRQPATSSLAVQSVSPHPRLVSGICLLIFQTYSLLPGFPQLSQDFL